MISMKDNVSECNKNMRYHSLTNTHALDAAPIEPHQRQQAESGHLRSSNIWSAWCSYTYLFCRKSSTVRVAAEPS